jgi:hypothetical protein
MTGSATEQVSTVASKGFNMGNSPASEGVAYVVLPGRTASCGAPWPVGYGAWKRQAPGIR